jgi:threonine aldolase
VWDEAASVVRWMCSWDTTESDVKQFVEFVRQTL